MTEDLALSMICAPRMLTRRIVDAARGLAVRDEEVTSAS